MGGAGELFSVEAGRRVEEAAKLMSTHDFSQISITKNGRLVGSLNETHLYDELVKNPDVRAQSVEAVMQQAFPFVDISTPVELLASMISPQNPAVLVRDFKTEKTFIITRSDIMRVLIARRERGSRGAVPVLAAAES
jgi:cystathionine beta-synthase